MVSIHEKWDSPITILIRPDRVAAVHVFGGMLQVVGYRNGTLEMVLWGGRIT